MHRDEMAQTPSHPIANEDHERIRYYQRVTTTHRKHATTPDALFLLLHPVQTLELERQKLNFQI